MKQREIKIAYFEKNGKLPAGIYKFKKPNSWYPVVYFRKPKVATQKEFDEIVKYFTSRPYSLIIKP